MRGAALASLALSVVAAATGGSATAAETSKQLGGFVGGPRSVFTGGFFTEPSDVAVYRGGAGGGWRIFVAEAAGERHARVQRLDRHGNFERAWGRNAVRPGVRGDRGAGYEVCRAAVSGAAGCGRSPAGGGAGELRMPTALGVSEATGDVYVMDRGNRRVQRFDIDGRFLAAWGWGVATGASRYEVCAARCRPGRVGRSEGNANAGQLANAESGAIAVGARGSDRVFVGDEGNARVLELTAAGRFVRGWGWGVANGGRRFESCTAASGCRAGRPRPGGGWPRHLAVGRDGVVFAAEAGPETPIVRFDPHAARRRSALMPPLGADHELTGGLTTGMAVDASSGRLVVGGDPFGPMAIDEIVHPGGESPTVVAVHRDLPYMGSVNGIDVAGGAIYIAKSTNLSAHDPAVGLDGCAGGRVACNGLAVLAPRGRLAAVATHAEAAGPAAVVLTGALAPWGVARYRLQLSTDGRRWHAAAPRYLTGRGYARVVTAVRGLRAGTSYRLRLLATRRGPGGNETVVSNPVVAFTAPRR